MALISGVPPAPSRARRPLDMGLQLVSVAGRQSPNPVQPVQPVPAPTQPHSLTSKLYPPHSYAATQAKTVIEVDGVPFINDEVVLGDDIVRPPRDAEVSDPEVDEVEEPGQQALPPQTLIPTAPEDTKADPRPGAQATPWPESLRILRDLPSQGGRAG